MANTYDVGDLVEVTATFYSGPDPATRVLADPTGMTFSVLRGDGSRQDYVWPNGSPLIAHKGTGIFALKLNAYLSGAWTWRAAGTGAVTAGGEKSFIVNPSAFS